MIKEVELTNVNIQNLIRIPKGVCITRYSDYSSDKPDVLIGFGVVDCLYKRTNGTYYVLSMSTFEQESKNVVITAKDNTCYLEFREFIDTLENVIKPTTARNLLQSAAKGYVGD